MDAWENPIIEASEWNTFLAQFYQGWPDSTPTLASQPEPPTENIIAPFSDPVGAVHHEASSSNFGEPFYQECFLNTPEPMFPLESFERSSRAQGKLPMSDSYTQFEFPIDEVYHRTSTFNTTDPVGLIAEHSPEFEELVKDSWVFICNYDRDEKKNQLLRGKLTEETTSEETTPEVPLLVKPERHYKSSNRLSIIPEEIDISNFPDPVCSCTGAPRKCYRWGKGGWTSACCTAKLSQSPLPARVVHGRNLRKVGRKMSPSTYRKVIEKLYTNGYNFHNPIDLKEYWAKLGTNQSVVKW